MRLCPKFLCAKAFCAQWFLRARDFLSHSKSFLACRTAEMSWGELRGDEKGCSVLGWDENSWEELTLDDMWEEMGWHEKIWEEVRRAHMIWDEMKCGVWSASVKCEECNVKCEESVWLTLHCTGVARRCMHGPGWRTAHTSSSVVVLGSDSWKLKWHMRRDELG